MRLASELHRHNVFMTDQDTIVLPNYEWLAVFLALLFIRRSNNTRTYRRCVSKAHFLGPWPAKAILFLSMLVSASMKRHASAWSRLSLPRSHVNYKCEKSIVIFAIFVFNLLFIFTSKYDVKSPYGRQKWATLCPCHVLTIKNISPLLLPRTKRPATNIITPILVTDWVRYPTTSIGVHVSGCELLRRNILELAVSKAESKRINVPQSDPKNATIVSSCERSIL